MTCDISCANVRTPSYFAPCVLKVVAAGAKPYFSAGIACATPINSCSKRFSNSSCACTGDIWVPAAIFAPFEPVCADPASAQPPKIKAVQKYRRLMNHLTCNFAMFNSLADTRQASAKLALGHHQQNTHHAIAFQRTALRAQFAHIVGVQLQLLKVIHVVMLHFHKVVFEAGGRA